MRDCPASNVERWEQHMTDRPKDFPLGPFAEAHHFTCAEPKVLTA